MAHDPKLEIFKLILTEKATGTRKTFLDLFRKKLNYSTLTEPYKMSDIFKLYHEDFIRKMDVNKYKKNEKKKKGFTIAKSESDGAIKSHISSPFDKHRVISGLLDGGKYGINRSLGNIENTEDKAPIGKNHIVSDNYYFLIFAPLGYSVAIVMIQGYSESKISDIFRDHLLEYFKHEKELISEIEIFVPNIFKEKYLKKAVFKSIKFSSGWNIKSDFEGPDSKNYEIEVRVEIIDKSKVKSNYQNLKNFIKTFGNSNFKPEGGVQKKLAEFSKKSAKMESNGKEQPYSFDNEDNITPVILLRNEGIEIKDGEVPDFDQINVYCRNLLSNIIEEIMPSHAIKEL